MPKHNTGIMTILVILDNKTIHGTLPFCYNSPKSFTVKMLSSYNNKKQKTP